MEFQTLQDATYFIIHETEGFKQNVYYDGKGIPTFGLGVAFIGYNSKNNSFSAISRIGNTPISSLAEQEMIQSTEVPEMTLISGTLVTVWIRFFAADRNGRNGYSDKKIFSYDCRRN